MPVVDGLRLVSRAPPFDALEHESRAASDCVFTAGLSSYIMPVPTCSVHTRHRFSAGLRATSPAGPRRFGRRRPHVDDRLKRRVERRPTALMNGRAPHSRVERAVGGKEETFKERSHDRAPVLAGAFAAILCLPTAALSASAPPDYQEQQSNVIYKRVDEMAVSPLAAGGVRVVYRRGVCWSGATSTPWANAVQCRNRAADGVTAVEQPSRRQPSPTGAWLSPSPGTDASSHGTISFWPLLTVALSPHAPSPDTGQEHEAIRPRVSRRRVPCARLAIDTRRHPHLGWPGASFRQAAIRSARRSASPTSAVRPTRRHHRR